MNCRACGAELRPGDRFCGRCGAKQWEEQPPSGKDDWKDERYLGELSGISAGAEKRKASSAKTERKSRRGKDREKPLYDEKLYRDSFLDRGEDGQHALMVTLLAILIAIVCMALAAIGYYYYRKNIDMQNGAGTGSTVQAGNDILEGDGEQAEIVILSDGSGEPAAGQVTIQDADAPEPGVQQNAGGESPAPAAPDTQPSAGSGQQPETAAAPETQKQTEKPTEKSTEKTLDLDASRLEAILSEQTNASKYAVYVYDLASGRSVSAGESDSKMYATATITVPILYTAAVMLDQGAITLNDPILYVNSIGGRGLANPEVRQGRSYPLSDYLATMLHYSDNNCMNCLIDFLSLDIINRTCQSAGFSSVDLQRPIVADVTDGTENYVSARDLAMMTKELYNGKYQHISRDFMRQYFCVDEGDANYTLLGLADSIPAGTMFLNQNGKGDTRYSEVAVIGDEKCSYIISIMLMGDYGFYYEDAVKEASGYVYESMQ